MANNYGGMGAPPVPKKKAAPKPPPVGSAGPSARPQPKPTPPKGGGGGTTPTPPVPPAADPGTTPAAGFNWEDYLSNWGFDQGTIDQLSKIFQGSDVNQDVQIALHYIRSTDWYAKTFPGIQEGINKGLINDESGYRAYANQLDQYYQRYFGRSASTQEVVNGLTSGQTPGMIGAHFQGQAYISANGNQIQYQLGAFDSQGRATDAQLSGYGDTTAGLDNLVGTQLSARLDLARQKMQRIFQGTLATPSLSILKGGSLQGTNLSPQAQTPDVTA